MQLSSDTASKTLIGESNPMISPQVEEHEGGSEEQMACYAVAGFSPAQARNLRRQIDLRLLPMLTLTYLLSSMHRGNNGNGKLDVLMMQLSLTGNSYNIALGFFETRVSGPVDLVDRTSIIIIRELANDGAMCGALRYMMVQCVGMKAFTKINEVSMNNEDLNDPSKGCETLGLTFAYWDPSAEASRIEGRNLRMLKLKAKGLRHWEGFDTTDERADEDIVWMRRRVPAASLAWQNAETELATQPDKGAGVDVTAAIADGGGQDVVGGTAVEKESDDVCAGSGIGDALEVGATVATSMLPG
ncbi:hypothetical protein BU15DRAFT_63409 [Melanogaster broomeanus]|nr:hypothetical protein BU15DRAFT_63409 [Melanogaster broomeanus]